MEKQAGPLANQVFQPVQVTQVPPPPRAQEPQIAPQQQQPGIGQQFGQAMATKMITKGVDAVTGLPVFTSLGFKGGNKVPSSPSPSYAARGDEVPHTDDDKDPLTWLYEKPGPRLPAPRPQAIGPLAQTTEELNKWYQDYYDIPDSINPRNIDDPYLDNIKDLLDPDDPMLMAQNQGVVFDLHALPPRLRSEYIQRLKSGMGHDEIIRLFESRAGKNVTYAEEGMRVRMPLAKPIEMDESYITKGMPKQLRPPLATDEWANYTQKLPMNTDTFYIKQGKQKPSAESWWQKAERTGLFGVPGTNNVYVDPGKGMIAYQREDVKPFTWMWNKGRNFLGFGAPLAERSE